MTNDASHRLKSVAELSGETSIIEVPVRLPRAADLILGPGLSEDPNFRCPSTTNLIRKYRMSDVVVGGAFRMLMKDNFVIRESLFGIPSEEIANAPEPDVLPFPFAKSKIGILGFLWTGSNYYHWLTQVLTSIDCCLSNKNHTNVFIVFPELDTIQEKTLRILGYDEIERLVLSKNQQLCIPQLEFSDFFRDSLTLTRIMPSIFRRLKQGVRLKSPKNSRIYISRRDASFRFVTNESDVIKILEQYGFVVVCPGQLELEEQISCFHDASVVIGPHGQGLTHTVYCNEGTIVYELMPENYKNVSIERLAINGGLRYFSDLSTQEIGTDNPQVVDLTIDTDILKHRLSEFGL